MGYLFSLAISKFYLHALFKIVKTKQNDIFLASHAEILSTIFLVYSGIKYSSNANDLYHHRAMYGHVARSAIFAALKMIHTRNKM